MNETKNATIMLPLPTEVVNFNWTTTQTMFNMSNDEWQQMLSNFSTFLYRPPQRPILAERQDSPYCNNTVLIHVTEEYKRNFHGYICMMICLFGTLANLANMVVLTRKDMAGAPINRVLTALAFADMLVMLEYIPFVYYHSIIFQTSRDFTYLGAVFILFHMNFSTILHTISVSLTIALAVWRYVAIRYPHMNQVLCSNRRCTQAILTSYIIPFLLCLPYYFTFSITPKNIIEDKVLVTLYVVSISDLASRNNDQLFMASFWLYSVIFKLLPCLILTVISIYLIKALCKAKKRKQVLRTGYELTIIPKEDSEFLEQPTKKKVQSKSERRADRTTKMLVAVLLLFLITELPQGVLALLSVLLGKDFFQGCYNRFGETMDLLALLNGAINFILYCSMSRQFRATFGDIFKQKLLFMFGFECHKGRNGGTSVVTTVQNAQVPSIQNTFV